MNEMHRLDEASIIDSMRRVYYRRLCEVLGETETRDKRGNFVISPGLKVRHKKSQFEYTVEDVHEDPKSGKMVIILQSPEAPRFDASHGEQFVGEETPMLTSKRDMSHVEKIDAMSADETSASLDDVEEFEVDEKDFEKDYEVR
jgi:hypothetical protein